VSAPVNEEGGGGGNKRSYVFCCLMSAVDEVLDRLETCVVAGVGDMERPGRCTVCGCNLSFASTFASSGFAQIRFCSSLNVV
jgi:hypothetical protein